MLTEIACRNAAPRASEYKLADAGGLYLRVRPSGSKSWCWKYRHVGRERKLTIGSYPTVSLKQARAARDSARANLENGNDPAHEKRMRKLVIRMEALNSFEAVARAWHSEQTTTLAPRYARQILERLEINVFPYLGPMPIKSISPPLVLAVIREIEARGAHEMAHRVRLHVSDVFVWAISSGLADQDPANVIRKALKPTDPKLRPAEVKLAEARSVIKKTEDMEGAFWGTLLASRLLALTAARPGVLRLAEKGEFEDLDGDSPLWRIPASKMKLTRRQKRDSVWEFVIPLSHQAVAVAKAAMLASPNSQLLFPSSQGWRKPISDSTLSKLYREAGFRGRHVPHGWRASFSTIMNERAAADDRERDRAIIDLMLAHSQEGVEPIYNRAIYMPRRREIAQEWADLLTQGLLPPHTLLPANIMVEAAHDGHHSAPVRCAANRAVGGATSEHHAKTEHARAPRPGRQPAHRTTSLA